LLGLEELDVLLDHLLVQSGILEGGLGHGADFPQGFKTLSRNVALDDPAEFEYSAGSLAPLAHRTEQDLSRASTEVHFLEAEGPALSDDFFEVRVSTVEAFFPEFPPRTLVGLHSLAIGTEQVEEAAIRGEPSFEQGQEGGNQLTAIKTRLEQRQQLTEPLPVHSVPAFRSVSWRHYKAGGHA